MSFHVRCKLHIPLCQLFPIVDEQTKTKQNITITCKLFTINCNPVDLPKLQKKQCDGVCCVTILHWILNADSTKTHSFIVNFSWFWERERERERKNVFFYFRWKFSRKWPKKKGAKNLFYETTGMYSRFCLLWKSSRFAQVKTW